jgi:hypothetical protein
MYHSARVAGSQMADRQDGEIGRHHHEYSTPRQGCTDQPTGVAVIGRWAAIWSRSDQHTTAVAKIKAAPTANQSMMCTGRGRPGDRRQRSRISSRSKSAPPAESLGRLCGRVRSSRHRGKKPPILSLSEFDLNGSGDRASKRPLSEADRKTFVRSGTYRFNDPNRTRAAESLNAGPGPAGFS